MLDGDLRDMQQPPVRVLLLDLGFLPASSRVSPCLDITVLGLTGFCLGAQKKKEVFEGH